MHIDNNPLVSGAASCVVVNRPEIRPSKFGIKILLVSVIPDSLLFLEFKFGFGSDSGFLCSGWIKHWITPPIATPTLGCQNTESRWIPLRVRKEYENYRPRPRSRFHDTGFRVDFSLRLRSRCLDNDVGVDPITPTSESIPLHALRSRLLTSTQRLRGPR